MILSHVVHIMHSWRRYNACMRELSALSDLELADIGLTRSGIPWAAWRVSQDDAGVTSALAPRSDDR